MRDTRPSAEALLNNVLRNMSEQGSARTQVRGTLGVIGQVNGDGELNYDKSGSDLTMHGRTRSGGTAQPVRLSVVDDIGYLRSPLARSQPGTSWLRVAPGGKDFTGALLSPALRQLHDAVDPRSTFAEVTDATRIQHSAPDTIEGRPATRYDLRLNTRQAAAATTDAQRAAAYREAADNGRVEQDFQLWVNDAGLPARFSTSPNISQPGAGDSEQQRLTSTYSDWATPTNIAAPAPQDVGGLMGNPTQARSTR